MTRMHCNRNGNIAMADPVRWVVFVALGGLLLALPAPLVGQEKPGTISWEGTWLNRRYNTTGPLKCTASQKEGDTYEARFEGTFMNSPFDYTVSVKATPQKDRTLLEGNSTIDGDPYEWSGYVRSGILYGSFRSQKGHNGEFRLKESRN